MTKKKNKSKEPEIMDMKIDTPEVVTPEYMGRELVTGEMDYSHLPVVEQQAFKCRDKMLKAVRESNKSFMELAAGLLEAYTHESYYEVWGCNFETFAEQQLGIGRVRAYMLKDVAAFVRDKKIAIEDANLIGWTKLSVIASGAKKNNELPVADLLDKALDTKVRDLQQEVKKYTSKDSDPETDYEEAPKEKSDMKVSDAKEAKHNSLKLALIYEAQQAKFVEEAIGFAANELNLDSEDKQTASKALAHICESWLEMKNVTPVALEVDDWIKFIRKKYGVSLVRTADEDSVESVLGGFEAIQEEQTIEKMIENDDQLKELIGATDIKQ